MFGTDERGQAIQVGAVILFSFVVIGLSVYQANVVPQQNKQIEFDHSQEVQSDMVDLRNGIVRAANADESGATDISLGTGYPTRVFALNANPASGRFATTEQKEIEVTEGGSDVSVCPNADETVRATYEPSYSYYQNGPTTVYENTFVYSDTGDAQIVKKEARLVFGESTGTDADNVLNLVAAFGDVSRAGSQPISIDTYSGVSKSKTVSDPVIEFPTNAQKSTWETALGYGSPGESFAGQNEVTSFSVSNGTAIIELNGDFEVVCTEVGIDEEPPGGVASIAPVPGGGGNGNYLEIDDEDNKNINPTAVNRSTGGEYSAIKFGLVNTDSGERISEISSITVDVTSNSNIPDRIEQQGGESSTYNDPVFIEGSNQDGSIDKNRIQIGNSNYFTQTADIDPDSGVIVYMNQFQVTSGGGSEVDMRNSDLRITVEYVVDGTMYTQTLTVRISNAEDDS